MDIANVNRARTQKIRRVRGKVWWAKRRRKIVRRDNGNFSLGVSRYVNRIHEKASRKRKGQDRIQ